MISTPDPVVDPVPELKPVAPAAQDLGPWLLISDVDDTLLGDDAALGRFVRYATEHRDRLRLVYSSGRFIESILESVHVHGMPEPDWVIGGVGTQMRAIRAASGGAGDETAGSAEAVPAEWRRRLAATYDAAAVRELLADLPLTEQPEAYQSDLKISYYTTDPSCVAETRQRLLSVGWRHLAIHSSGRDLDILPQAAGKRGAACYLADALGYDADHVVCSGDSGNDLDMLTCGFNAVIVSNHRPELAEVSGPRIYRARAAYADGVIEGLQHWTGLPASIPVT